MNDYKQKIISMITEMDDENYLEKIFYYVLAKYRRSKEKGSAES